MIPSRSATVCQTVRPAAPLAPTTTFKHLPVFLAPHPDVVLKLQEVVFTAAMGLNAVEQQPSDWLVRHFCLDAIKMYASGYKSHLHAFTVTSCHYAAHQLFIHHLEWHGMMGVHSKGQHQTWKTRI